MSLLAELKRRNVIRVAIAYVVIAWVQAQVATLAFDNFGAPDWVSKSVLFILILGLPLAIFFAWAFEMTPEGLKKESEVDRSQSITGQTGRKLDFIIIGVLVIAVGFLAVDRFGQKADEEPTKSRQLRSPQRVVDHQSLFCHLRTAAIARKTSSSRTASTMTC